MLQNPKKTIKFATKKIKIKIRNINKICKKNCKKKINLKNIKERDRVRKKNYLIGLTFSYYKP